MAKDVRVKKWVIGASIIFACLAIVAVGLGVYFGTRCSENNNGDQTTMMPPSTTTAAPDIRLPQTLIPTDYILTIQTYLPSPGNVVTYPAEKNFTFDGDVTILFDCNTDTNVITLQSNQIEVINATLMDVSNGGSVEIDLQDKPTHDDVTQFLIFTLASSTLKAGNNYSLQIFYVGILNDVLAGFYRSSYTENGVTRWLAVTQFEPTDARRALPCFDEPELKAVFHLTLIHPADMSAISNAMEHPAVNRSDNWAVTTFDPTLKMSTYLFAMCVSDFVYRNQTSHYEVNFRVWARPSFIEDSWWALEAGPKVLTYYADYFDIQFPLKKQDMVALPDFGAGAMENWGMVTYREIDLLYNNKTYASIELQKVTVDITHELGHQWFGDLVTLLWWDDLWLNEGFATFLQYKGADNVSNNNFDMKYQFIPLEIGSSMSLDQLTSSHPIYDPTLTTPDEINADFDSISYDKGGSVIRQLEFTLSEDVFRSGLHEYLHNHSYSNADHQDLWNSLQQAVVRNNGPYGWNGSLLDVTEFMNPWILQSGFPLISVTKINDTAVTLTQSRFLLPGNFSNPKYANSPYNFTWYVPIRYIQKNADASPLNWVQPNLPTTLTGLTNDWLLLNPEVFGYYRVNYYMDNWNALIKQLQTDLTVIDVRNRAQLVDDAMNLARSGQMDYNVSLTLTKYLSKESSLIPWYSYQSSLVFFSNMFALSAENVNFGRYIKLLAGPLYNKFGFTRIIDYPNVTINELHELVVSIMCKAEDKSCLGNATEIFQTQLLQKCGKGSVGTSQCSIVDQNLRKPVYCAGIAQGAADEFLYLFQQYPLEQVSVERDNILYGLCCSKDPWALTKLLNEGVNPNSTFIRQQDVEFLFRYIGSNPVGMELLWNYFVANFDEISILFSSGSFSLSDMVIAVTQSFNTPAQVQEMQQFLMANGNRLGSGYGTFVAQLETAESNVMWMQNYFAQVNQWFIDYAIAN